ncbi:uncharacterized protein METZ01_LOCUS112048, partial [marine metagenome]
SCLRKPKPFAGSSHLLSTISLCCRIRVVTLTGWYLSRGIGVISRSN